VRVSRTAAGIPTASRYPLRDTLALLGRRNGEWVTVEAAIRGCGRHWPAGSRRLAFVLAVAAIATTVASFALLPAAAATSACELIYTPQLLAVAGNGTAYFTEYPSSRSSSCAEEAKVLFVKRTPGGYTSVIARDRNRGAALAGAVDSTGDLYVLQYEDVVKITPHGRLSVVAGEVGKSGPPTPGTATQSKLDNPFDIAVDSDGNLYIADDDNDVVEEVTPPGQLSILAGKIRTDGSPIPGPASQSTLSNPFHIAVDQAGDVYVENGVGGATVGRQVSEISPQGNLSVIAGNGSPGAPTQGAQAANSPLDVVWDLAIDGSGNLYLVTSKDPYASLSGALSSVELNASGTVTQVTSPAYGPMVSACGRHYVGDKLRFDSAGDAFVAAYKPPSTDESCIVEVTPQGRRSVVARSSSSTP